MYRTLIQLADGTEISSGSGKNMNVRKCTLTQCCNSGEELTIGSVCSACSELTLQVPDNTIRCNEAFTLFRVDDAGNTRQIGVFTPQKPQKAGDCLWKVTAYDNVSKLDVDLTQWLIDNIALLHDPRDFVGAVCNQCGVRFKETGFYYHDYHYIPCFEPNGPVTGRKLLQWVAEFCGYFCVADPEGNIRFKWYRDSTTIDLSGSGEAFRYKGKWKLYNEILPCDGVRIVFEKGTVQYPFREINNPYIIKDNPIFERLRESGWNSPAQLLVEKLEDLDAICSYGGGSSYLGACEVTISSGEDIEVGDIIIADKQLPEQDEHPNYIYMIVMTKKTTGQQCTLKCTGSYRRSTK